MTAVTWIENAYELLDEPGEWYLDRSRHELFYRPRPGEDLATARVVAIDDHGVTLLTETGRTLGVNFTELENRFGNGHGRESKNHDKRKNQCENLFHLGTPPQIGLSLCGWDRDWNRSRKSLHTLYPWVSGLASLFWEKCYHTS